MKTIKLFIVMFALTSAVIAQPKDTLNTIPDEQVIVNKEFDEKGNLIRFDSTYVFNWSSTDTTINFPGGVFFQFDNNPMMDMENFFNEFFNDSTHKGYLPPGHSLRMPFGFGDDFFNQFQHKNDSLIKMPFNMFTDSLFFYHPNNIDSIRQHLLDKLIKNEPQHDLFLDFGFPQKPSFIDKEQQKEWEEMMKRHEEELEDFKKKWKDKK